MITIKDIKDGDPINGPEVLEYETITRPKYIRTRIIIDYTDWFESWHFLPKEKYGQHHGEQAWLISSGQFNWVILDDGSKFSVHPDNYKYASVYKAESYIDNSLTDMEKIYGKGWGKK